MGTRADRYHEGQEVGTHSATSPSRLREPKVGNAIGPEGNGLTIDDELLDPVLQRGQGDPRAGDLGSQPPDAEVVGLIVPQKMGHVGRVGIVVGGAQMIPKFIGCVFAATALAGCCASGTGCYAPVAGSQVEWDGLYQLPQDEAPKKKTAYQKKDVAVAARPKGVTEVVARPQTKEEWEQQQAADRADEAKLTKRLKICSGCSTATDKADDANDSNRH
jgi:hypothetical protein